MVIDHDFVVSRMKVKETGEVIIPTSKTVVSKGDLLLTVCSIQDESAFQMVIGPVVDMEWEAESQSNVVSRRILVTKATTTAARSARSVCTTATTSTQRA